MRMKIYYNIIRATQKYVERAQGKAYKRNDRDSDRDRDKWIYIQTNSKRDRTHSDMK